VRPRAAALADRVFDALRHREAFAVTAGTRAADFESLDGHTYLLLVTFRRNGDAVPTPVWFGRDRDRLYVKTAGASGKVTRVWREPRVLVAASTGRGRPVGPVIDATARILPPDDWPHAEAVLRDAYGAGRRLSERVVGGLEEPAYLEIRPRPG